MANPPFNLKGWRAEDALLDDPRFIKAGYSVMPPVANANYAWILHMLSKLDVSHGIAGFLLANGALNADGAEYTLRKEIIEKDRVEAIIILPRDMFYTVDLSCTLWIINMNKKATSLNGRMLRDRTNEILFMDLRRWNQNIEEIQIDKGKRKKKTILTDDQIADVKKVYADWQSTDTTRYKDVPEFCRSVMIDEIRSKDYSLAPSKYIEFIDHDLEIDYAKEMARKKHILYDNQRTKELFLVFLVSAIGLGFNLLLMFIFVRLLGMNTNLLKTAAKIMATGIVFVWNFVSRKIWIYREPGNDNMDL